MFTHFTYFPDIIGYMESADKLQTIYCCISYCVSLIVFVYTRMESCFFSTLFVQSRGQIGAFIYLHLYV